MGQYRTADGHLIDRVMTVYAISNDWELVELEAGPPTESPDEDVDYTNVFADRMEAIRHGVDATQGEIGKVCRALLKVQRKKFKLVELLFEGP
mgnify:CR=1 FL=1|jgi:hypothetical protein